MSLEAQTEGKKQGPPIEIEKAEDDHYHVIKLDPKRFQTEQEVVHVHVGCAKSDFDWRMRRGELIPVPEAVIQALRNAKYPRYEMPSDEDMLQGKKEKIVGEVQRFTFQILFRDISKDVYMKVRKRASDPTAKPITEKEVQEILDKEKRKI